MSWRPIRTAPKDGTRLLLGGDNWVNIGYFSTVCNRWIASECFPGESEEMYTLDDPTHWMPLPEPPSGGEK